MKAMSYVMFGMTEEKYRNVLEHVDTVRRDAEASRRLRKDRESIRQKHTMFLRALAARVEKSMETDDATIIY